MSKMNFNGKKETAEKNECQNNEEATNLRRNRKMRQKNVRKLNNVTESWMS